jgi:hypothetical protein
MNNYVHISCIYLNSLSYSHFVDGYNYMQTILSMINLRKKINYYCWVTINSTNLIWRLIEMIPRYFEVVFRKVWTCGATLRVKCNFWNFERLEIATLLCSRHNCVVAIMLLSCWQIYVVVSKYSPLWGQKNMIFIVCGMNIILFTVIYET